MTPFVPRMLRWMTHLNIGASLALLAWLSSLAQLPAALADQPSGARYKPLRHAAEPHTAPASHAAHSVQVTTDPAPSHEQRGGQP
jgi:hypothetical protein